MPHVIHHAGEQAQAGRDVVREQKDAERLRRDGRGVGLHTGSGGLRWLVPHLPLEVRKGACPALLLRLTISTHSCELLVSNAPDYS